MECPKCEGCHGVLEPVFSMAEERLVVFICPTCRYWSKPIGREWRWTVEDWWDEKDQAARVGRAPGSKP